MIVQWPILKQVVDQKQINVQYVDLGERYWVVAIDGYFKLECFLDKNPTITDDLDDFETNYKPSGNTSPKSEVVTQFEKPERVLKMASGEGEVNEEGIAVVSFKVPGVLANGEGRYVQAGTAWFDVHHKGDKIEKVEVIDVDNVLGYGENLILITYHDDEINSDNMGWYLPETTIKVDTLGAYGFIKSELYLKITAKKGEDQTTGTIYINMKWGI